MEEGEEQREIGRKGWGTWGALKKTMGIFK